MSFLLLLHSGRLGSCGKFRTASVSTTAINKSATEPEPEQVSFIMLKAPFHVHPILGQINHILSRPGQSVPFLILPDNLGHPVIELPQTVLESLLQNIGNFSCDLQSKHLSRALIQPKDSNYCSLPCASVRKNLLDNSGMALNSSTPNTTNRQEGADLVCNKTQNVASGTSPSLISTEITVGCSSAPMQSTPKQTLMALGQNLQNVQGRFIHVSIGLFLGTQFP